MDLNLLTEYRKTNFLEFKEFYKRNNSYDENFEVWSIKEKDALVLANIVHYLKPKTSLIVGLYKGLSSLIILDEIKENPTNKLYGIDPFFENYIVGDNYYSDYRKAINHFDENNQLITIKGFSTIPGPEANTLSKSHESKDRSLCYKIDKIPSKFDFCFIDGDHDFEIARKDFFSSLKISFLRKS